MKEYLVVVCMLLMYALSCCLRLHESVAVPHLNHISLGADEGDAAILAVHQHLAAEVLPQQVLRQPPLVDPQPYDIHTKLTHSHKRYRPCAVAS